MLSLHGRFIHKRERHPKRMRPCISADTRGREGVGVMHCGWKQERGMWINHLVHLVQQVLMDPPEPAPQALCRQKRGVSRLCASRQGKATEVGYSFPTSIRDITFLWGGSMAYPKLGTLFNISDTIQKYPKLGTLSKDKKAM